MPYHLPATALRRIRAALRSIQRRASSRAPPTSRAPPPSISHRRRPLLPPPLLAGVPQLCRAASPRHHWTPPPCYIAGNRRPSHPPFIEPAPPQLRLDHPPTAVSTPRLRRSPSPTNQPLPAPVFRPERRLRRLAPPFPLSRRLPLPPTSPCWRTTSSTATPGHEERFSIYVHASREKPVHVSPMFIGRDIHSEKVVWGKISMVDAEKRLLANALLDTDNQHFVLLSDSCVPLHNFDYVYSYLTETNVSFIDSFEDPGPHGTGRYIEHMLPEIEKKDWRKGSQWFTMKRSHAVLILADNLYYNKFKLYCKPGMEGHRNCYADEHYLPTLFHMFDPTGIANWSVTHVDWSEGKWHPKAYIAKDVTFDLLKNITSIHVSTHVTSETIKEVQQRPCLWNGMRRPCYLFARKFYPEALDNMMHLFSNFTAI